MKFIPVILMSVFANCVYLYILNFKIKIIFAYTFINLHTKSREIKSLYYFLHIFFIYLIQCDAFCYTDDKTFFEF